MNYFIKLFLLYLVIFFNKENNASKLIEIDQNDNQRITFITSPVDFHGFSKAHEKGIKGNNQIIAFIEFLNRSDHPQFRSNQVTTYDVSHEADYYGNELSTWRKLKTGEKDKTGINLDWIINDKTDSNNHGNHIIGIAVGQPGSYEYSCANGKCKLIFKGGCCPDAKAINYNFSTLYPNLNLPNDFFSEPQSPPVGLCVHTYEEICTKMELSGYYDIRTGYFKGGKIVEYEKVRKLRDYKEKAKDKIEAMSKPEKKFYKETKIDDSLMQVFREFFKSEARVLNASLILKPLMAVLEGDFFTPKVPHNILEEIANGLEEKDKILVLSANNDSTDLSKFQLQHYFRDFCSHSFLKDRILIAINIIQENLYSYKNLGTVSLPGGEELKIALGILSNWPGSDLKEFAICALGETISGWENSKNKCIPSFSVQNGTSEAAPVLSSLCTLIAEKYPLLNGKEIVKRIKDTAIKFGDPNYTGCGFLYASTALEL